MSKLIKEMLDALNAVNQNKTQPYDRQGEVKRIEGKTAWVKLEGSDRETPIQMTIACDVGDTVQARIGGGSAWLTGNLTAPPTDDKKANQAISMVTNVVQEVQEQVEEALEEATDVEDVTMQYCLSDSSSTFVQYGDWSDTPPEYVSGKYYWVRSVLVDDDGNETYGEPRYSQETQLSVETSRAYATTNAHFWYDSTGAYVTDSTQDDYKSSATNKYATRVTPTGILQSYSGNTLSSWTSSGIAFYQGDSSNTPTASFGSGGVNLYGSGSLGASITSSGMTVYSGGTNIASFGSTTTIGKTSGYHVTIDNTLMSFHYTTLHDVGGIKADNTSLTISSNEVMDIKSSDDMSIDSDGELDIASSKAFTLETTKSSVSIGTTADTFRPTSNGVSMLGSPNYHWTVVYADTGSINTSDRKKKDVLGDIDFAEDFIMSLEPIQYQWKASDHRRIHMGFIAQDVAKASRALGKDLSVYDARYKGEDEEGQKYFGEEVDDEKLNWGMSYAELIAPLVKVVQTQNKRITELEKRVL